MPTKPKFYAIYFTMGHYNEDDCFPELVGFDCPFDDSLVLDASSAEELERKIKGIMEEGDTSGLDPTSPTFEGEYPDIIVDDDDVIQVEMYRKICSSPNFDPDKIHYSSGRETLTVFWKREKWRWFGEE